MRETDIAKILFPVELQDVYFNPFPKGPQQRIASAKVVVNTETKEPISVVGKEYQLLQNSEALELGGECFRRLFDTINLDDMEVFNIYTPHTRSFCYIDILHKKYEVNIWQSEVYVPYIRITNSYNRLRALSFDVGFSRKLCSNGVIFEKKTIKFKFSHTSKEVGRGVTFQVKTDSLKLIELEFIDYMHRLRELVIPPEYSVPLMTKALGFNFDLKSEDLSKREREGLKKITFENRAKVLVSKYYREAGANAYALFNAITEYASNPPEAFRSSIAVNGLQKKAGRWVEEYASATKSSDFSIDNFLREDLDVAHN